MFTPGGPRPVPTDSTDVVAGGNPDFTWIVRARILLFLLSRPLTEAAVN